MRTVVYGGAISLDGFLAGPGEAIDWLRWSDDSAAISAATFRGADAMLMGRKTFEFAHRMGGGPRLKGVTTYVFSRTLERLPEGADGMLIREDAVDFVRRLKAQAGGKIVVMGGGALGSALLVARLVDEIGFSIHPVLLGGGTPAFLPFAERIELERIEARPLARDCALLRYRVGSAPGEKP